MGGMFSSVGSSLSQGVSDLAKDNIISDYKNAPEGLDKLGYTLGEQRKKKPNTTPEVNQELMSAGTQSSTPQMNAYNAIMNSPEWQQLINPTE